MPQALILRIREVDWILVLSCEKKCVGYIILLLSSLQNFYFMRIKPWNIPIYFWENYSSAAYNVKNNHEDFLNNKTWITRSCQIQCISNVVLTGLLIEICGIEAIREWTPTICPSPQCTHACTHTHSLMSCSNFNELISCMIMKML